VPNLIIAPWIKVFDGQSSLVWWLQRAALCCCWFRWPVCGVSLLCCLRACLLLFFVGLLRPFVLPGGVFSASYVFQVSGCLLIGRGGNETCDSIVSSKINSVQLDSTHFIFRRVVNEPNDLYIIYFYS
jgi:hypothetical protein